MLSSIFIVVVEATNEKVKRKNLNATDLVAISHWTVFLCGLAVITKQTKKQRNWKQQKTIEGETAE